ncbi:hypothetical protein C4D60_Mb06t05940 [Musa balbisiana]|uniref:Uncharacterized protein n=1 Tax=Musa balbisiana TaxID=52838 RepID=A0A4S8IKZ5_MUSBA|nr:hypothetical protein C4D60_Mb06t05940 [Musa balbisiana]
MRHSKSMGSTGKMGRRSSMGGSRQVVFPAGFVSPAADPPSPDVPRCLCSYCSDLDLMDSAH